eukprot:434301-Pyramimonas_sp.AAC.1
MVSEKASARGTRTHLGGFTLRLANFSATAITRATNLRSSISKTMPPTSSAHARNTPRAGTSMSRLMSSKNGEVAAANRLPLSAHP